MWSFRNIRIKGETYACKGTIKRTETQLCKGTHTFVELCLKSNQI